MSERKKRTLKPLSHPALTPMPKALRNARQSRPIPHAGSPHVDAGPTVGARRAKPAESKYVATPKAPRALGIGVGVGLGVNRDANIKTAIPALRRARRALLTGGDLFDGVADGTSEGWLARILLQRAAGAGALLDWERRHGRSVYERLALVDRVLAECGFEQRGGWQVSQ